MEINVPIHSFPISFTLPWEGRELSSGEGKGQENGLRSASVLDVVVFSRWLEDEGRVRETVMG